MRSFLTTFALSSVLFSFQATALPRPLLSNNADTSVGVNQTTTSAGVANPFPDAGQSTPIEDTSVVSTASSGQAASSSDSSSMSTPSNGPGAGQPGAADASTPLTLDNSSADTSATANTASTAADANPAGPPAELTGKLLGMPNCNGTYYDAKWDTCHEATGTLTTKAGLNRRRYDTQFDISTSMRQVRRQASRSINNSEQQVKNPTVLNGQAGIDDGAVPRKQSSPPTSERQPSVHARADRMNQFREVRKRQTQDKTPGNTNFWNTPFEPVESQSPNPKTKIRRQSRGAGNSRNEEDGPLMGEDQVVDGSAPYPPIHKDKIKRHPGDDSSNRNRFSAKLQESANDKRTQSDIATRSSNHRNTARMSGQGVVRRLKINERQVNNGSSNQGSHSGDPTGYLAALGNAAIAGDLTTAGLPKAKHVRRDAYDTSFDSVAPHRDGNHIEVGPPGPGGARNVIINRRAVHQAENPNLRPRTQIAATSTIPKRSRVEEDEGGKLIVTQSRKRAEIETMANKRVEVYEDANGKLVVHHAKRHENDGVASASMPQRRESIVKRDEMSKYRHGG